VKHAGAAPAVIHRLSFRAQYQNNGCFVERNLDIHAFEYMAGLFTVIIGLAVVDLAISFHKLARHRRSVTWDPLAMLAALYSLLLAITMWFKIWGIRDVPETGHYFFFLTLCAEYFLLFLLAAASLPDDPNETCDLRIYYDGNRQYFWTLVLLFQISTAGHALYFFTHGLNATWTHIGLSFVIPIVMAMLLLATPVRKVHYLGLVIILGLLMFDRAFNAITMITR
jgi:hypothetical protein